MENKVKAIQWVGIKYPSEPRSKMQILRFIRENKMKEQFVSKIVMVSDEQLHQLQEMGCKIIEFVTIESKSNIAIKRERWDDDEIETVEVI